MTRVITFQAIGVPQQQGSTRAFVVKGKAITTSANKNLKPWRDTVHTAAEIAAQGQIFSEPVKVSLAFRLLLPASAPKTRIILPDKQPDLDKLIRSCLDSMSGTVFDDDKRVCFVAAGKRYTRPGEQPGVTVTVEPMEAS